MNEKFHLADLAAQLASKTLKKQETTDSFLRELFALIEEALIQDQVVKIKDIGTFKLQLVSSRRIANIQTGETQEVPEHYKVVFVPDKKLASSVNEPYRHLSSVEFLENGEFNVIESTKDETIDTLDIDEQNESGDFENTLPKIKITNKPIETPSSTDQAIRTDKNDSPIASIDVKQLEKLYEEQKSSSDALATFTNHSNQTPKNSSEDALTTLKKEDKTTKASPHTKPKKKSLKWIFGTLLFGFIGLFCYYYITHNTIPSNQIFTVYIGEPTPQEITDSLQQVAIDSIKKQIDSTVTEPQFIPLDTLKYDATKFLTQIARQYYGNKYFWVYIFEENKDQIEDFNNVRRGTMLVIPDPKKYAIDAQDTASLNRAKEIGAKLIISREVKQKK